MPKPPADLGRRIRALALIRTLERHVLQGEELKPSQVSAALALLKKVLPDLATADAEGAEENAHEESLRKLLGPDRADTE